MKYANDVRHLLVVLIVLFIGFVSFVLWWGYNESREQEKLQDDVLTLSLALDEAHEENPEDVPKPEDVIDDPPTAGRDGRDGLDGRDGRDGRPPTSAEIAEAAEEWLALNIHDQLDPDDPEIDNPEIDDPEIQDPEIQDPEIDDPEIQDPEIQDPEINDPDPSMATFEFEFSFANKIYTVTCTDPDGDLAYSCVAVET